MFNRLITTRLKFCSINFLSTSNLQSYSSLKLLKLPSISNRIGIVKYSSAGDVNNDTKWNKFLENERQHGKLVYKSSLEKQLFWAKSLSLSSSMIGIAILPFLATALQDASILANILVFSTSLFFILATPILFQYVTRRHVNRMHYDSQTDTFTVFLYNFFLRQYTLQFKTSDVVVPDIPGVFTSFMIKNKNRNLFVNFDEIKDRSIVVKMFGYDKPYDPNKNKNKDDDDDDD